MGTKTSKERLEYARQYYIKNKDKCSARNKQWKSNHPNYMKEYLGKYYEDNKEKHMLNVKQWQSENVQKVKIIKLNNKTRNRDKYNQRSREIMKEKRLRLIDILGGPICIKCGYSEDWRALTFDHIRDDGKEDRKNHTSSYMLYTFYTRNPEIARSNLQVLCCNCNNIKKYDLMGYTGS